MESINHFQWDKNKVSLLQKNSKLWEVKRAKIEVIIISDVINGDNDTTIFTIVDSDYKLYHLDILGLRRGDFELVYNFFREFYDIDRLEKNFRDTSIVFYPEELRGIFPYNKSILTWVIRSFHNAGGGKLNKRIKNYIALKNN